MLKSHPSIFLTFHTLTICSILSFITKLRTLKQLGIDADVDTGFDSSYYFVIEVNMNLLLIALLFYLSVLTVLFCLKKLNCRKTTILRQTFILGYGLRLIACL